MEHLNTILAFVILWNRHQEVLGNTEETRLFEDLFQGYNSKIRPVSHHTQVLNVTIAFRLFQLIEMNEKLESVEVAAWITQRWTDSQLSWNANVYDGITQINTSPHLVWKPDIVLYNNLNDDLAEYGGNLDTLKTRIILHHTGTVKWLAPIILKSRCKIDVKMFPFDTQKCYFKFGSWTYGLHRLNISGHHHMHDNYHMHPEWHLTKIETIRTEVKYPCCPGMIHPDVTFHVHFQRKSLFYVINLIFPIVMITCLSMTTFILPAESGERWSVAVTLLLAATLFLLPMADMTPESSESVPLLGVFFIFCIIEIICMIVSVCYITRLYHRTNMDSPMGSLTTSYILEKLSYKVGVRKNYKVSMENNVESLEILSKEGTHVSPSTNFTLQSRSSDMTTEESKQVERILQKLNNSNGDGGLSNDDEWRIVAQTIERCLFMFFIVSFAIGCIIILGMCP